MAKFFGAVGYVETVETSPGIWEEVVTERNYYGDIIQNNRRLENGEYLNNDIVLDNLFSIVSDPYSVSHIFAMRYVKWMGISWKVTNVDVKSPRLILTIGGVYNGPPNWPT